MFQCQARFPETSLGLIIVVIPLQWSVAMVFLYVIFPCSLGGSPAFVVVWWLVPFVSSILQLYPKWSIMSSCALAKPFALIPKTAWFTFGLFLDSVQNLPLNPLWIENRDTNPYPPNYEMVGKLQVAQNGSPLNREYIGIRILLAPNRSILTTG